MNSQSAGTQPAPMSNPPSASDNAAQSTQISISESIVSVTNATAAILKSTAWPRRSIDAAEDLVRVIDNAPNLKNIPGDDNRISADDRTSLQIFFKVLEDIKQNLQEASDTYGEKESNSKFGGKVKHLITSLHRDQCTAVLESCRKELENALASLPDDWAPESDTRNIMENLGSPANPHSRATAPLVVEPPREGLEVEQISPQAQHPAQTAVASRNTLAAPAPGQAEASSGRREWLGTARTTLTTIEAISGAIPIAGSFVGAAAKVGVALVSTLQTMDSNEEITKDLESRTSRLVDLLKRLDKKTIERQEEDTTAYMTDLIGELKLVREKVKELESLSTRKKVFSSDEHAATLKAHQETIQTALEEIQVLVSLNTTDLLTQLYDSEQRKEQRRLLDRLGDANYGAKGDAIEDVICLPGTRAQILGRIDDWIRNLETLDRVLWIRGMAGRGKSTIASTVAYRWRYRAACAIFHFRRGQSALDKRLICALARQLGTSGLLEVKESVLRSVRENEDIAQGRLQEQFLALFVNTLKELKNTTSPVLLVIDALDECESTESAVKFVNLIDQYLPSLPRNVKFLLTTRPEAPLLRALEPRLWNAEDLDSTVNVDDDIAEFLKLGFLKVKNEYSLEEGWPPPDDLRALVHMSQGLFQWAHTAIEYMLEGSPQLRLEELLTSPSICDGLDGLYLQIFSKAFKKATKNPSREDLFLRTLGTLVVAPYPISLEIFAYIFADHAILQNRSQTSIIQLFRQEVLADLGSLIHVPRASADPIRLVHTSVRDLLVDRKRCAGESYWVNLASNHHDLTSKFLRLMQRDLRTNICNLSDLSKPNSDSDIQDLVQLNVPKGLQYCCYTWSLHLATWMSGPELGSWEMTLSDLKRFSEEQLFSWLEVMSLIGLTRESMTVAKQVKSVLQARSNVSDPWLTTLWNDAHRFITAFYEPISYSVPHIYASALPFCPVRTPLWKCYGSFARTRILSGPRDLTWPLNLWSKHNHWQVRAVAISPDSTAIAFGLEDGRVQQCDPESGIDIGKPLKGHDNSVESVAFSPDGRILASGSNDRTVRLWDAESGASMGEPLKGHDGCVWSVAFSPKGNVLASGSSDATIKIWDVETGAPIGKPLVGHGSSSVRSVAFSPNRGLLASGSDDGTIRLWDPVSRAPIGEPLAGHGNSVWAIAFSPDDRILASGSEDGTIRIWNPETGAPIDKPLKGHDHPVHSVAFSSDGKVLASGSSDHTIRLWESRSGAPIGKPLEGHIAPVSSLAFSPDGKILASGSSDETIRIWDAENGVPDGETLTNHEDLLGTFDLTSENTLLKGGLKDKMVRLSGTEAKVPVKERVLEYSQNLIWCIASSLGGKVTASGSADSTVQLWDPDTGAPIGTPLEGHDGPVLSVAFSPDGEILASGSEDKMIRLWDTKTGAPIGEPLKGHDGLVCSVTFSPDGSLLVSGSKDDTIRFWNGKTRASIAAPLECHGGFVWSVAFSANGRILASGSGYTIRFWDVGTRSLSGEISLVTDLPGTLDAVFFLTNGQLVFQRYTGQTTLLGTPAFPILVADSLVSTANDNYKSFIPSLQPILLGFQGQWVTFSSNRLFWLPQKYWSRRLVGSNLILLSYDLLVLAFDETVFFLDVSCPLDL